MVSSITLLNFVVEKKNERNLLTEEDEKEMGILLMAKSLDAKSVDMESSVPTMDEVILVNDVTNV